MEADLDKLAQELSKQYQYVSKENDHDIRFDTLIDKIISYYENIIDCMPGNVYWFDSNLVAVGCNKNVLKMFGFKSIDEFRGLTFEEMGKIGNWAPEATAKFKNDTLEVLKSGQPKLNEEEPPIPHNDGGMIHFLSCRVPIFDTQNNVAGVVGISIDVTDRKKMEQALIAKEMEESANRAKSKFIANMSHDIRTPLSGMIGMAEAILKSTAEPLTKQYAEDVVGASKQLLQLLNSILEVSKIDENSKHVHHVTFNLKALLQELVELLRPSLVKKELEFVFTYDKKIPVQFKGNAAFIHRVLLNILGNAIKFTNKGRIQLIAELASKEKNTALVKVSVIDTGTGISENQLEEIFEPFTRLTPSYEGTYKGSGLGLYITKRYVEYLEGKINVTSVPGEGTAFEITLPLQCDRSLQKNSEIVKTEKTPSHRIDTLSNQHGARSVRVLVVEDDPIAGKVIAIALRDINCEVALATTGSQALEEFKHSTFDLIYMDIGLPDLGGDEVIKIIRSLERNFNKPAVPIIVISAHIDDAKKAHCIQCGADIVMRKPITQNDLREHYNRFVNQESSKMGTDILKNETFSLTEETHIEKDNLAIDLTLGESIVGTRERAIEMLAMLKNEIQADLPLIEQRYQASQWNELKDIIHKFYGGVCFCGTPYLKTAAHELDRALKEKNREHNKIVNSFELFTTEIKRFLMAYERLQ